MIKKGFSHIGIFFLQLLSHLPLRALYAISSVLYIAIYYIVGYRRQVVRTNLTQSFPEKSISEIIKIEKEFYHYFADLMVEIVKMSSISKAEVLKRVKMINFETADAYFAKGESVVACSGHYGNWELGMMASGLRFEAVPHVIYKPINNKPFEAWFNKLRTKFGNVFVPMRRTLRDVVATKNQLTLFCFASDQTPKRAEIQHRVMFLNQSTPALMGLEKIAIQTKRPVFYFDVKRVARGYYEIECVPMCMKPEETSPYEITELFFKHLEESIHKNPAYWLWSHKRWKHNN